MRDPHTAQNKNVKTIKILCLFLLDPRTASDTHHKQTAEERHSTEPCHGLHHREKRRLEELEQLVRFFFVK